MCPDCKDTGVYVGLKAIEPCKTCGGKKPDPAPVVTYEQVSDKWQAKLNNVGDYVWTGTAVALWTGEAILYY